MQYNKAGKPIAIVADGATEGFKTNSPVKARLAPDVAEALMEWREEVKKSGELLEDNFILPWRSAVTNKTEDRKILNKYAFLKTWNGLRKKWRLPKLRSKDLRHWAATQCRKHGLSKQASAALMGHDPAGDIMRDWYDNPPTTDILEEQALIFPEGLLGALKPARLAVIDEFTSEELNLLRDLKAKVIDSFDFMAKWKAMHSQRSTIGIQQILKP